MDDTEIIGERDDLIRKVFEILFPYEKYSYDLKQGYIGCGASLAPNSRFTIAKIALDDKGGKQIPPNEFIV